MEALKLNLGCGYDIRSGYVNIDRQHGVGVDMVVDLDSGRLPFMDGVVDEIYMSHVLEHLVDRYGFILECHRVLKPSGVLLVKLPISSVSLAHQSYTHRFDYFKCVSDSKLSGGFQKNPLFTVVYQKRRLRRLVILVYRFRDWFLNLFSDEWEYKLVKNEVV